MNNKIKIISISVVVFVFSMASKMAFADNGEAETAVIPKDSASIAGLLNLILKVLTAGVFLAAVASIIFASVLYATSASNSSQVAKAKNMIFNTIIGVIAYGLIWGFINWIIPGGLK